MLEAVELDEDALLEEEPEPEVDEAVALEAAAEEELDPVVLSSASEAFAEPQVTDSQPAWPMASLGCASTQSDFHS